MDDGPWSVVLGPWSSAIACQLAFLILSSLCLSTITFAQTPDSLPDIAPQEFEIIGTLDVSFPALERQPLSGFNFSETTADVPSDRRPFVDPLHRRIAYTPSLTFSPLQGQTSMGRRAEPRGAIEVAGGRYLSRLVSANYQAPLSESILFSGAIDYFGRAGHEPYEDNPELQSSRDALEGALQFTYDGAGFATGLELDGFFQAYPLYSPDALLAGEAPNRNGRGGRAGWFVRAPSETVSFEAELGYGLTRYATDFAGTETSDVFRQERRVVGRARATANLSGREIRADALVTAAGIDAESPFGDDVVSIDAGGSAEILMQENFAVQAGARLLRYRASDAGGPVEGMFVSPVMHVDFFPRPNLHLYARNAPEIQPHSLRSLFRYNPYLVDEPALQPTVRLVNAAAGARVTMGRGSLRAQVEWEELPNFLYFEQAANGRIAARYGAARILGISADGTFNLPGNFFSTLGIAFRTGRLTDADTSIPYFAPVTAHAALSYAFSKGRLAVGGEFLAPRFVDQMEMEEVGAYFFLDLSAEYRIFQSFALTGRLRNAGLGAPERWLEYPQPAYVAMLGIQWEF